MHRVRQKIDWPGGEIRCLHHQSKVLKGNPWGDPVARVLNVYLPPGYDEQGAPLVTLWDLAAFTNSGPGHLAWRNHGENLPQRLDRLIHEGVLPPVVVAIPDCYSSLGGNQYLNSSSVGRYADYIVAELVPFLAQHINVIASRSGRGAFGKSSGAYGALSLAMHFPTVWGAVAAHAADVGFDVVYRPDFPLAASVLQACDGDIFRFLERFWSNNRPRRADYVTLMMIAMAASYDPDDAQPGLVRLPFDIHTCALDPERWGRWLSHDPLNMVETHCDALKSLYALYLDAGNRDQYNLQYGTRRLSAKLEKLGVSHHYEEFDGTHSGMDRRLDISLPFIANALLDEQRTRTGKV